VIALLDIITITYMVSTVVKVNHTTLLQEQSRPYQRGNFETNSKCGYIGYIGYKDTRIQGYKSDNYFIEFTIVIILK